VTHSTTTEGYPFARLLDPGRSDECIDFIMMFFQNFFFVSINTITDKYLPSQNNPSIFSNLSNGKVNLVGAIESSKFQIIFPCNFQ